MAERSSAADGLQFGGNEMIGDDGCGGRDGETAEGGREDGDGRKLGLALRRLVCPLKRKLSKTNCFDELTCQVILLDMN